MPSSARGGLRTLVVDCYLDELGGARNVTPYFEEAEVLRAAHEPLPDKLEADAVILTGSAASVLDEREWALELEQRVAAAAESGMAILGLCFGHQLLARAVFGGRAVRRAPIPELGWEEIERSGEDALFSGVAERFTCFVSHSDEVDPLDPNVRVGASILASTAACAVEAFRVKERPLWGVQFHSEMQLDESRSLVESRLGPGSEEARRRVAGARATPELVAALFRNFRAQVQRGM